MQKKRIIMLGGVKHCGKSTLGKLLAELLGASFADTDTLLEKLYFEQSGEKASCREIFRQLGEENFRRLEADAIMGFAASATGKWVAALGGGAVANQFIPWQKLTVLRVMADAPEEVIRERILASGIPPFLGGSIDSFNTAFPQWFATRRNGCIQWAELIFAASPSASPSENAAALAKAITENR